jgi:chromosome partitioning protein
LSQGFFGSSIVEQLPAERTVAALFDEAAFAANADELICPTDFEHITLLPANHGLAPFNTPLPEGSGIEQFLLREFIEDRADVDIVLIDCPPNLYRCSWTAMLAADWVVVPVPPEDFGTQGLRAVHQAIDQAKALNPALRLLGHLVTRRDRRLVVHRSYEQRLRNLYGEMVLDTVIPEASAFKVALACRMPVETSSPRCSAAGLTRSLAREILDRVAVKHGDRQVA